MGPSRPDGKFEANPPKNESVEEGRPLEPQLDTRRPLEPQLDTQCTSVYVAGDPRLIQTCDLMRARVWPGACVLVLAVWCGVGQCGVT